jgi:hypothetical protein
MSASTAVSSTSVEHTWHPKYHRSEALGNDITELCGYINAATSRLLEMIREFDQEGLWQLDGICSCAHWLNWKCGIGMNAAREKVRVANALGDLAKISSSFALGEISYSKVRAMTRVATPENEDYLLQIAKHGTAYHVETLVRKYRRAKRLQAMDDANHQHRERTVQVYYEPDGSMVIHARLPAEQGAMLLKALELAMQQAEQPTAAEPDVSAETSAEGSITPRYPEEREAFDKQRADALANIAESYLANGPAPSSSADRYQVVLHVSAETLGDKEGELSHIADGPRVCAETARRICCDTGISVLTEDKDGVPLTIGRKSRIIPPALSRALRARDEGCRFPGCTHKHYIDGHHIRHWSKGGETSLANLVRLCRHHHRLVHEGGFSCEKTRQGQIEFRDQRGHLIARTGYIPALSPVTGITERLRDRYEDLHINAQTCVSKYDDSRIDWNLAVGALFQ